MRLGRQPPPMENHRPNFPEVWARASPNYTAQGAGLPGISVAGFIHKINRGTAPPIAWSARDHGSLMGHRPPRSITDMDVCVKLPKKEIGLEK